MDYPIAALLFIIMMINISIFADVLDVEGGCHAD
jgi:hypothetical protein